MKKLLAFIFLLSFLDYSFSQVNVSVTDQKDNFSLYLRGVQSELLGDYQSAIRLYDASLRLQSNDIYYPSLISNLNLRLATGDYGTETEKLLAHAESLIEDSMLLKYMKVEFCMGKNDYKTAEKLCYEILSSEPGNSKIAEILPMIDYSMQNLDSSLVKINDYESKYGINHSLYSLKREILARNELYDSLLSYNVRISELYPENLSFLADLANVHSAMGHDSIAYNIWNTIETNDPNTLEFIFQSNQFYSSRKYADKAISTSLKLLSSPFIIPQAKEEIFRNIFISFDITKDTSHLRVLDSTLFDVAIAETDTTVVQELALGYYFFRNDFVKSLQLLDTMTSRSLSSVTPFLQKANILNTMGRFQEAIDFLDSSSILFPHAPNFVLYKAELLKDNLSEAEAINFVKKSLKSETEDSTKSQYLSYIADLYFKQGKQNQAFKIYEESLTLFPDNPLTLNNYAYFLAVSGNNLEKALVMSHKCNSIVSNNSTYLDTEAYVLYKLGMYSEAKKLMDIAFSLEGEDFSNELYLHYADILTALGNKILAKSYYQKSLDAGADPTLISDRLKSLER